MQVPLAELLDELLLDELDELLLELLEEELLELRLESSSPPPHDATSAAAPLESSQASALRRSLIRDAMTSMSYCSPRS
jgi:hypothetical protein